MQMTVFHKYKEQAKKVKTKNKNKEQ